MKNAKIIVISIALVMLLAITAGCVDPDKYTEEFDGMYGTNEDTVLTVKNRNGNIDVTRYSGDQVDLHVDMESPSQDRLDDLDIVVTEEDGDIDIEAKYSGDRNVPSANMIIKVPHGVFIERIVTSNGNVIVEYDDLEDDVNIASSNGNIRVNIGNDLMGNLTADTSNGNIKVTIGNDLQANLTAGTSNGDIEVYIGPDQNADLMMTTSNGKAGIHDLTVNLSVDEEKVKEGTMGTGGPTISMTSSNGNVDIYKT